MFIAFLLVAIAPPGGRSIAQEQAEAQTLPILQFRSYDSGWLRYYNLDKDGERKLAIDNSRIFLFRHVVSAIPLGLTELGDAGTIARLIDKHRLSFNIKRIDGRCDTEKLRAKGSDILCVPGSSVLPIGYILLALYHPQAHKIVALTTTIDNSTGRALPAGAQPALENTAEGCGPYVPGQWITAEDYAASGLNLIVNKESVGNPITDYSCVLPADGGRSYLQAYSLNTGGGNGEDANDRDEPDESQKVDERSLTFASSRSGADYRKTTESTSDDSWQPPFRCRFLQGTFYLDCVLFGGLFWFRGG